MLSISKAFPLTLAVEKKNIIRDRIEKKYIRILNEFFIIILILIIMNKNLFTYKKSGVDINAADKFVNFISNISSKKKGKKKFNNIGGFGSITIFQKYKNPKIVACTDGVGTKIEIANMINKYDTIGIDLVAMSVNDLIVQGAKTSFIFRLYIY